MIWTPEAFPTLLPVAAAQQRQLLPEQPRHAAAAAPKAAARQPRRHHGRAQGKHHDRKPREPSPPREVQGMAHKASVPWTSKVQQEHRERQTTCAICLGGTETSCYYVCLTGCKHRFHEDCWKDLQKSAASDDVKKRCPVCKDLHGNNTSTMIVSRLRQ